MFISYDQLRRYTVHNNRVHLLYQIMVFFQLNNITDKEVYALHAISICYQYC